MINIPARSVDIRQLDVYTTALIKTFLAGLSRSLLSSEFAEKYGGTRDTTEMKGQIVNHYKDQPYQLALLKYFIKFLAQVAANSETKMVLHNLAVAFAPSLIRSTVPIDNIPKNPTDPAIYMKQVKQYMSLI
jgi:hypothetical protein